MKRRRHLEFRNADVDCGRSWSFRGYELRSVLTSKRDTVGKASQEAGLRNVVVCATRWIRGRATRSRWGGALRCEPGAMQQALSYTRPALFPAPDHVSVESTRPAIVHPIPGLGQGFLFLFWLHRAQRTEINL